MFSLFVEFKFSTVKKAGNSLVVQWIGHQDFVAKGLGFNPCFGNLTIPVSLAVQPKKKKVGKKIPKYQRLKVFSNIFFLLQTA